MEPVSTQQPIPPQRVVTYAGFWRRFVEYLIDKLILSVVSFVILVPFLAFLGLGALSESDFDPNAGWLFALVGMYFAAIVLIFLADWLYFAIMETMKGGTLGKMALGITVTDMNGNMVTFGRASGRYFGKILSGLILWVGYIMAGFTQQKQALHDVLAGCLVVNK